MQQRFLAETQRADGLLHRSLLVRAAGSLPVPTQTCARHDTNRDSHRVSIPRQSRGHYKTVSRSKRLEGVANATPQGWSHRYGGESPPEAELVKPLVLFLLGLDVLSNHPLVTTDR